MSFLLLLERNQWPWRCAFPYCTFITISTIIQHSRWWLRRVSKRSSSCGWFQALGSEKEIKKLTSDFSCTHCWVKLSEYRRWKLCNDGTIKLGFNCTVQEFCVKWMFLNTFKVIIKNTNWFNTNVTNLLQTLLLIQIKTFKTANLLLHN